MSGFIGQGPVQNQNVANKGIFSMEDLNAMRLNSSKHGNYLYYLIVAGGGSGGWAGWVGGAGGGGGGVRTNMQPNRAGDDFNQVVDKLITLEAGTYTVTVGGGGAASTSADSNANGTDSSIATPTQ